MEDHSHVINAWFKAVGLVGEGWQGEVLRHGATRERGGDGDQRQPQSELHWACGAGYMIAMKQMCGQQRRSRGGAAQGGHSALTSGAWSAHGWTRTWNCDLMSGKAVWGERKGQAREK